MNGRHFSALSFQFILAFAMATPSEQEASDFLCLFGFAHFQKSCFERLTLAIPGMNRERVAAHRTPRMPLAEITIAHRDYHYLSQ
jgi:hypothetical protein